MYRTGGALPAGGLGVEYGIYKTEIARVDAISFLFYEKVSVPKINEISQKLSGQSNKTVSKLALPVGTVQNPVVAAAEVVVVAVVVAAEQVGQEPCTSAKGVTNFSQSKSFFVLALNLPQTHNEYRMSVSFIFMALT